MCYRKGVTLVELLLVILILGALTLIAVPRISQSGLSAKIRACNTNIDTINTQVELYWANTGTYPANITGVTQNLDYFPDGPPVCPLGGTYTLNDKHRAVCDHSEGQGGGCQH